ncbi:hypothetical protein [Burkholderia glumae]|uniref:hypothetical protein n=1 Tax=Burkholderia glumae TaxID=337 RepID=UPI002151DAE6|nr:hypothetical protein [Burkholderia glumae]
MNADLNQQDEQTNGPGAAQPPLDPNAGAPIESLAPVERAAGVVHISDAGPVPRSPVDATSTIQQALDTPALGQEAGGATAGESASSRPDAAVTPESSVEAPASGIAAAPLESSGNSSSPSVLPASSTNSSSSATTTLSTAAVPATSSNPSPPAPTTAASPSATADATPADAAGIPPTTSPALDPALDPALGQIPAAPATPDEPAEPAADLADAAASPLMFEIHSVTQNVPPIRIYADGHVEGLPDGYQLTINHGHALAAELASLKADDRHLSLLASWHREMEVLGRGLSGEVTRLLGETKKYLEDVL